MYDRVVLKVGGSIITDRDSDEPRIDRDAMRRTAREIASYDGDLVLVHGAGSFGHPLVADRDITAGLRGDQDRIDLAWIQRIQNELNAMYCTALQDAGVPAFPLQPSACTVMDDGEIATFRTDAIRALLDRGMVPAMFGTPACDTAHDVGILSGDLTAPAVAADIDADMVLHATDVDGVYDADPSDADSRMLDVVEDPDAVTFVDGDRPDVSGEMAGKVGALFDHGRRGRIFSGIESGTIRRALQGEPVGTLIEP